MLSDTEKKKIYQEEMYRFEVKKQIEGDKPKRNKLVSFFNTNLGLFLLSSVLLSGLTFGYTIYSNNLKNRREEKILKAKLKQEINTRISYIESIAKVMMRENFPDISKAFMGSADGGEFNRLEEFRNRTIYSLTTEYFILQNQPDSMVEKYADQMHTNYFLLSEINWDLLYDSVKGSTHKADSSKLRNSLMMKFEPVK